MSFVNLVPPATKKPRSQSRNPSDYGLHFLIRDQFAISTWLCLGAVLQIGLYSVMPGAWKLAVYAPILLLVVKFLNRVLQAAGITHNPLMDGVIQKKTTAQIPDQYGNFADKTSDQPLTVLLLGAKNNHPMGLLAPGFKEFGDFASQMVKDLDYDGYEKYGYLGSTNWIRGGARQTANELMTLFYFRSREGLETYAHHSPSHRKGWDWWNKHFKKHPHLGINHETYQVQPGNWENIYINFEPTMLGATRYARKIKEDGVEKEVWVSPVVDASRGKLRTHKGRMGLADGTENEKYGAEPYALNP